MRYAQSCSSQSESVDHFTIHVVCHTPRKVLSLFLSDHTATATSRFGSISPDLPALVLTVTRTPDSAQDQTLKRSLIYLWTRTTQRAVIGTVVQSCIIRPGSDDAPRLAFVMRLEY
ncbi:hypothetical protein JB92DRAFT_2839523 [Gautieria morchelliformis]|nr:hypothetical protein JB92DRAFT_2839523 [Gautieria morchelliformis]